MKVMSILVDEMPQGCFSCTLQADYGDAHYYCAALRTENYGAGIPWGMDDIRRHDCPLTTKEPPK